MEDQLTHDQKVALKLGLADDCSIISLPNPKNWNDGFKSQKEREEILNRGRTLQAGIRLSYEEKVNHAYKVIRKALNIDSQNQPLDSEGNTSGIKWVVSYSGGKDSTVLSHLISFGMGLKIAHVMSNTRMEYPETIKQVGKWFSMLRENNIECHIVWPSKKPKDLWKEIGVPLWSKRIAYKYRKFLNSKWDDIPSGVPNNLHESFRILKAKRIKVTDECCNELKKKPIKEWRRKTGILGSFTGIRCSESYLRRMTWIRFGSLYESGKEWIANPLSFWTSEDVNQYLTEHNIHPIKIPTVRGGSGCVTCMFGCHLSKGKNALQELKELNPKMHSAAINDWGYKEVLDELGIPYE